MADNAYEYAANKMAINSRKTNIYQNQTREKLNKWKKVEEKRNENGNERAYVEV